MKFKSNKFYFIVSLKDKSERNAARNLYDDIVVRRCLQAGFSCDFFEVVTGDDFVRACRTITKQISANKHSYPYLHIEAHGDSEYLALASGFLMPWPNICELFVEINISCKNNLFVSLATCFGGHMTIELLKNIPINKPSRAPAFGILGPEKEISVGQLEGYDQYFDSLIIERSINTALHYLKIHSSYENMFMLWTCADMYKSVISEFVNYYSQRLQNPSAKSQKLSNLTKEFISKKGRPPTQKEQQMFLSLGLNRDLLLKYINDMRRTYFMIDIYPENEVRFPKASISID